MRGREIGEEGGLGNAFADQHPNGLINARFRPRGEGGGRGERRGDGKEGERRRRRIRERAG